MSDTPERPPREPVLERLRRLGLKPGPPGPRLFRSRHRRFDEDENIFSKRKTADTDKTK